MIVTLPTIDATRLAADYSAAIRGELSPIQLANVQRHNLTAAPGIDHIHDYIDPDDAMHKALSCQLAPGFSYSEHGDAIALATARATASGYRLSRVLVACEFSRTVAAAFEARGHSVMSCDLKPAEAPGPHYRGDVRDILGDGWHMMIAHPDCTFLANSGAKHLVRGGKRIDPERWKAMGAAAEFFNDLGAAPIPKICRENPVMHKHARAIIGRRGDQYVQPYQFGHDVSKRTGLWLDNLAPLEIDAADYVEPRIIEYRGKQVKRWANQSPCGADSRGPSKTRGHDRSVFFAGIAAAMAQQWTGLNRIFNAAPAASITAIGGN